jgi:hypothetical protein
VRCPADLIGDFENDILLLLMKPVTSDDGTKHVDHVAYYCPKKAGGFGTYYAFCAHLNRMIMHEYWKCQRRWNLPLISGPQVASLTGISELPLTAQREPVSPPSEFEVGFTPVFTIHDRLETLCSEDEGEGVHSTIFADHFFAFLMEETGDQKLVDFARALMVCDAKVNAAKLVGGLTTTVLNRYTEAIKTLGKVYTCRRERVLVAVR